MNTINSISTKENTMFTNTNSLNLTSTITEVVQVPSKENNYTAVVQAEQSTTQGTIKDFGSASSEHSKTEDPKELLELARTEAHQRVSSITTHASSNTTSFEAKTQQNNHAFDGNLSIHKDSYFHEQSPQTQWNQQSQQSQRVQQSNLSNEPMKKQHNHNPNKHMSKSQAEFIYRLEPNHGRLQSLCDEKFGKVVENLNSKEANEVIQFLKGN